MLKELFASCLMLHACAINNFNSVPSDPVDSCDINIVQDLELQPNNAISMNQIHGLYNFKQEIDYSELPQNSIINFNFPLDGSTSPYLGYYVPFYYNTNLYYLTGIRFSFNNYISPTCGLEFDYYDYDGHLDSIYYLITEGDINDVLPAGYLDIFFNVLPTYSLDSTKLSLFNSLFTHDDNEYVVSYNGYYSFFTTGGFSLSQNVDIGGSINAGVNGIYFSYSVYPQGNVYYTSYEYYDTLTQRYLVTGDAFTPVTNLIINGKMTYASYVALSNVGVFAYVRDSSYDNTDFHDLLFTIMDTPVYLISRLFNFELFGMNLFIAFSGLLTLAVVIMIIRKIW